MSPRSLLLWSRIGVRRSRRSKLGEIIWGESDGEAAKRAIKVVVRLQHALGGMDLPECPIETVPGIGYRYLPLSR